MKLHIVRHGIAEERNPGKYPDDSRRPLTASGAKKIKSAFKGMAALQVKPDIILSSPYARARKTAEIIARGLEKKVPVKLVSALEPDSAIPEIVKEMSAASRGRKSIMLVGHEPHLSRLLGFLLSGKQMGRLELKKGALCTLQIQGRPLPGNANLLNFLSPRTLRLLSD